MSKKHFELLANALVQAETACRVAGLTLTAKQYRTIVAEIALACQEANGRFDRTRFFRACGLEY